MGSRSLFSLRRLIYEEIFSMLDFRNGISIRIFLEAKFLPRPFIDIFQCADHIFIIALFHFVNNGDFLFPHQTLSSIFLHTLWLCALHLFYSAMYVQIKITFSLCKIGHGISSVSRTIKMWLIIELRRRTVPSERLRAPVGLRVMRK